MNALFYIGVAVVAGSEILLFAGIRWVGIFFTPLVWTGYILVIDGLVLKLKGKSWITARRRTFLTMIPLSAGFWYVFEFFNLFVKNWRYEGLPSPLITGIGMTWAFATIGPAIMETAELVGGFTTSMTGVDRLKIRRSVLCLLMVAGGFCLVSILTAPSHVAKYLAILLWLAFTLLLDPINYLTGRRSILYRLQEGHWQSLASLVGAGIICGFLWEFWNYWAGPRWVYQLPYSASPKIFEMPLLGYLGFPLLAFEYYAFYSLTLNWKRSSVKV